MWNFWVKFLGRSCFKAWSGNEAFHLTISVFKILQRTKALLRQTDSKLFLIQQPLPVSRMDSRWTPAVSPGDSDDSETRRKPERPHTPAQSSPRLPSAVSVKRPARIQWLTPWAADVTCLLSPTPTHFSGWHHSLVQAGLLYVAWAFTSNNFPASASWVLGFHMWATKPLLTLLWTVSHTSHRLPPNTSC